MRARDQWFGHPRGLSVLFFTEMWERFSYYGMRAILILYMVAPVSSGGLGYSTVRAAAIYGWYTMLVYASAIPGGFVADRWIGHWMAVLAGGGIIALGHFSMAVPRTELFFAGLGLIVIGTGLLKPNVSSMVGMLYDKDDPRRDSGFSIFYMGINIGAMASPIVCGWLGQRIDWHLGFGAAGIGMLLGLTQYLLGKRWLERARAQRVETQTVVEAKEPFTRDEWMRILLIMVLFVFAIAFFAAFEQAGSSLTLFADRFTRLSILGWSFPSSWFQVEQPLFVLLLAPVFAWMWIRMGKRQPSSLAKFAMGLMLVGIGYVIIVPAAALAQRNGVRVSPMWLTVLYLLHTFGELCLSPVGLSIVTKFSPKRVVGLMMGIWFLAVAFGNRLAGWAAGFFDVIPVARLFTYNASVCIAAAVLLALLVKPILRFTSAPAAREKSEAMPLSATPAPQRAKR
jgi:POT family proton-dependent oligopeptide transporter